MNVLNSTHFGIFLAGSLSLMSREALAQEVPTSEAIPQGKDQIVGQAGIATLCIEKRSQVNYETGEIVTPPIYIDFMPKGGINTLYFPGSPAETKWKEFLNPSDPKKKAWIEETDIPEQAQDAFDLMKRIDKDHNGIVTYEEFEKGERGVSAEDKKNDLAFLMSLRCDSLYFTEGALNQVDPTQFTAYRGMKSHLEMKAKVSEEAYAKAVEERELERAKAHRFVNVSMGLGGVAILLGAGLVLALWRGRPRTKDEKAQAPDRVVSKEVLDAHREKDSANSDYQGIIEAVDKGDLTPVNPDLLAALGEETPPPEQSIDDGRKSDAENPTPSDVKEHT